VTALAVLASACSSSHAAAPAATTAPPSATSTLIPSAAGTVVPAYYRQHLAWGDCGNGFQCATLKVPLDYQAVNSPLISVAVIRLPAGLPAQRIGSLVINPGGPGASGIDYARYARYEFPSVIRDRFDIVSFDPRGVGQSTPVHCLSSSQLDAYVAANPVPQTPQQHLTLINESRQFAQECLAHSGALLAHVGTIDQARDMDVLRAALGDAKLTYLGKSYGTYLGAKYAQLFPTRIRALVLDGALDPAQTTDALNRVQAVGFQVDLDDFIANCVALGGCPLGNSQAAAMRTLDRLTASVDAHPLPAGGSRELHGGEFFLGLAAALYDPASGWPELRRALAAAIGGDGSGLVALSDLLTERQPNGTYTNEIEANTAINCIDRQSPRDVATYDSEASAFARLAPYFGAAIAYGSLPCAFWPVPPVELAHPVRAAGAPPILVIGTTRDPATPYVWAQALAHELASGVLLTFTGDGHTAYGRGSACIDGAVNAYLIDLQVPAAGTRCS